ncbi:Sensor histidine kinase CorS [Pseudomonas cannabina pv. alisalensis]|uniref:histidine kinase n=1 Tax=Pseudomonas cannabina TaxID=86840 RepID=A0A3M3QMU9_PSECA|nr:Sensor histidine kinase CorS [Pseudomonas cannabina pv. alisalensis]RMN85320.1 Sensor histidine kinase CorS [Pseudomonas cannabina]RMN85814.1 Sensor histidine kinase CorS [Pseudomonas cannabina pv. alisalensis]RMN89187.1 Sensor histidine kinase CorS [Pseudomonas cannabina]
MSRASTAADPGAALWRASRTEDYRLHPVDAHFTPAPSARVAVPGIDEQGDRLAALALGAHGPQPCPGDTDHPPGVLPYGGSRYRAPPRTRPVRHDARSYQEALRLILVELTQSLVKTTLLATSLILTFSLIDGFQARVSWSALAQLSGDWDPDAIQTQLLLWYVAVVSLRVGQVIYARQVLLLRLDAGRVKPVARVLMLAGILESVVWVILCEIALQQAFPTPFIGLLLVLFATLGHAMVSLNCAVPSLYLGRILLPVALIAMWFLRIGDDLHRILGITVLLYGLGLCRLARSGCQHLVKQLKRQLLLDETAKRARRDLQQLRIALQRARQSNTARCQLLAGASHDLRQPLQAQGFFLAALAGSPLDPQQRQLLVRARTAVKTTTDMLNTLLDLSRIELGALQPTLQVFALQPLLDKLEMELAPLANGKGLSYRTLDTELLSLSDPTLLELILRNLIGNAIRYTLRGGVLIACQRRHGYLQIEVVDTGVGIALQHQQEIFRDFHQLDHPTRNNHEGLGLGLAIVARLARLLGHPLTLASREGHGSTFRVHLPLVRPVRADGETVIVPNTSKTERESCVPEPF